MKPLRDITLTNTLSGKKELLQTRAPKRLTMYSCGPTVYGLVHIGNLRAALVADMFFRFFKKVGYDVIFVRNYTDVDDKIIKKAQEEHTSAGAIAQKYTLEVEADFAKAGIHEPTHKTTVTTHIPDIIGLIEKIMANGHGYVVDGEVLFSIKSFAGYGKLSHKNIDELIAGARVEVNEKKKNPLDFTLWKPAKAGEPAWDSPWGSGRPGWHIECSAMSSRWLGNQIDIHHGGDDLTFPHHENEIAQSEAASQKAPFVKYWLHNAFVNIAHEKMSKSLGNFVLARDFLNLYGPEVSRYLLLSAHYRSMIDFTDDTLDNAITALHRIYEAKLKALELIQQKHETEDTRAEGLWASFISDCEHAHQNMDNHFANDFNVAGALSDLFILIRDFNRTASEPFAATTPAATNGAQALIKVMEQDIGSVLGLGLADPHTMLKVLSNIKAKRLTEQGVSKPSEAEINKLIHARTEARKSRDFEGADRIRKELEAKGVRLKDTAGTTSWEWI